MDVCLGEPDSANRTLPVPIGCGIVYALLAKYVGTCLQNDLSLTFSPASAKDL